MLKSSELKAAMKLKQSYDKPEGQPPIAGSAICSAARPITRQDVVKEADRNYDLGRKHGLAEARPSLAATQRLLLEIAIEQRHHQEWRTLAMRLADESTAVLDNAHWEVKHGSGDLLTTIKAVREKYRLETQMPPNSVMDRTTSNHKTDKPL